MALRTGFSHWLNLLPHAKKKPRRRTVHGSQRWGARLNFESLERREMMATVPVVFGLPNDVQQKGVEVAIFATLTADYTPQSGGAVIPNGTVVYFDPTQNNGAGDYAAATAASDFTFALTVNAGQATVNLPDAYAKSGQIVIGVGSPPNIIFNPATANSPAGIATPTAYTNATNYYGVVEYAIDVHGWNVDLTLVDQIGFPITVTATPAPAAPDENGVGLTQNRGDLFNLYSTYIASLGAGAANFQQGLTEGNGYRILAPQHLLDGTTGADIPVINPMLPKNYLPGGSLVLNQQYYYWVTSTNSSGGETAAGNRMGAYPTAQSLPNRRRPVNMQTVNLTWSAVPGAAGYKIYRGTGIHHTSAQLVGSVSATANPNFIDTGYPGTPGTPPSNSYTYEPLNKYFNADLDTFFSYYENNTFSITAAFGGNYSTYTGTVSTNYQISGSSANYTVLSLTSPDHVGQEFLIFKPYFSNNTTIPGAPAAPIWMPNETLSPGAMIFGCDGAFNTGGFQPNADTTILSGLQNTIASAFNRGIATNFDINPNNWANAPLLTSATAGGGGSLTADTYYYVVTANTPNGETTVSLEYAATTAANGSVTLNWEPISTPSPASPLGFNSYNIYRSTTQGTGYQKLNTVVTNPQANNITSFVDDGSYSLDPFANGSPPIYYVPGTASNWYAAFVHLNGTTNPASGVSIAGLGYGFAYDDQGGQSSDFTSAAPTQISINLLPWTKQNPPPTPPTPNPHPTPPQVPSSLQVLQQPSTTKAGQPNSVSFQVFGAQGHPFHGGTNVTVQLVLVVKNTYTITNTYTVPTDPVTGKATLNFTPAVKGDYMLRFVLEDNTAFYSNMFTVKKGKTNMRMSLR